MVTKEQIDNYFSQNYDYLLESITKTKGKYNPTATYDPIELLSITYLHLQKNKEAIPATNAGIMSFTMRYMTNQLNWSSSETNKLYRGKEVLGDTNPNINLIDDESDLLIKINIEKRYNEQKATLINFYNQITDKQQKIMFQVIFFKGIRTLKELTKHFGIAKNYIVKIRKELYNNLNTYIENEKLKN